MSLSHYYEYFSSIPNTHMDYINVQYPILISCVIPMTSAIDVCWCPRRNVKTCDISNFIHKVYLIHMLFELWAKDTIPNR